MLAGVPQLTPHALSSATSRQSRSVAHPAISALPTRCAKNASYPARPSSHVPAPAESFTQVLQHDPFDGASWVPLGQSTGGQSTVLQSSGTQTVGQHSPGRLSGM
jgi:hypothetical protein